MVNVQEQLEQLSLEKGVDVKTLDLNFKHIFEYAKPKNPNMTDDQISEFCMRRLVNALKTVKPSGAVGKKFKGFIFGITGKLDMNSRRRKDLFALVEKVGAEEARRRGLIDEKGSLMDADETIKGKINRNFGKPLLPSYRSTLYVVYMDDNKRPVVDTLSMFREKADLAPVLFTSYDFVAAEGQGSALNSVNATAFSANSEKIDCMNVLKALIPDKFVPFEKLKSWHDEKVAAAAAENRIEYNLFAITEADIVSISPNVTPSGFRIVYVDDYSSAEGNSLMCWFPDNLLNVGVTSRVYLVVSPVIMKPNVNIGETEDKFILRVLGHYPIKAVVPTEINAVNSASIEATDKKLWGSVSNAE